MVEYSAGVRINDEKLLEIWKEVTEAANILHRCYFELGRVMGVEIPAAQSDGDGIKGGSLVETTHAEATHDSVQEDSPKN